MSSLPNEVRARTFGIALASSTLGGALLAGFWLGLEVALLVVAAGALVLVIALLWSSVAGLSGDTPLTLDEALGMGAPSAEEEQKRAVLRALKDLDYERSVGKISEADFREFSERYRAEARRLISALDSTLGPSQALAEKLAAERLAAEGLASAEPAVEPAAAEPAATEPAATEPAAAEPADAKVDGARAATPRSEKTAAPPEAVEAAPSVRQESES
jgi:hypothetical protein